MCNRRSYISHVGGTWVAAPARFSPGTRFDLRAGSPWFTAYE